MTTASRFGMIHKPKKPLTKPQRLARATGSLQPDRKRDSERAALLRDYGMK